ncbi:HK97-gp10 family putative phage morphogenesis protein [Effusibacillus pohliae]|uniref:HK97-gp10 family putative phage morphogenesis protein n=1 Tax=Effusibacillus pohliae TaxID=232270 RepID=UPI000365487E|nr:HK97-gp10 family putative phage morphogenesis protein [Effusibacillus pohliae]
MPKVEFTLHAAGATEVVRTLNDIPQQKEQAIKRIINTTAANIARKAKQRAPVDTGRLRGSIQMRPYRGGLEAAVGTNVEYAPYIEFGTGKGVNVPQQYADFAAQFKGHGGFPPPGVLLDWMKRHGIPAEAELAIRRKLFYQGIQARPFLFNSFEEEKPAYLAALRKALGDLQ